MNRQQAEQPVSEDRNLEALVSDYLLSNPSFFERRKDVLAAIQVPHLVEGATSLIECQVRILRRQLETDRNRLAHLISRAREYETLSIRLHALVLQLIAAKDPNHLCDILQDAMLREFHAEAVSIRLFPIARDPSGETRGDPLTESFKDFLDRKHALCGPLDAEKSSLLFGAEAGGIQAAALIPIRTEGQSGVLAIGSSDPERFHPDMGTDFLDRLGEIVSHKLRALPVGDRDRH
ncbi:DUF484 family protein [Imhoffiella purpurea]|uniref:DUF484 family protein n=1 Tax=Imhoffiella purpurea TaxID=1249627 RepID=W9VBP2_9GAMM|nr:DUF484 family protein [Imhoffiella purpurea]EXJ13462.1 hypothetical protein D779_3724 [Imhoffiella purpurea]